MGAETTVYVKVVRACTAWVEVDAVTLAEAKELVNRMPGVSLVLDAQYDKPSETESGEP